ncbi:MAG: TetR/AcrR family transcriptional regulator [Clostridiales bacterium]|nr:TetR/AcrR family transcriptional regulator [Clostridiales bacterium]
MAEKKDLRVIKSEKSIRLAFLGLMKEKGYANITITDIAERAEINRKTFYMHYESKEKLYETLTEEFIKALDADGFFRKMQSLKGHHQREVISNLMIRIKEHRELFNIMAGDETNPEFLNRLKKKLVDDLVLFAHTDIKSKDTHFTFELLSETYFALFKIVLQWWVNTEDVSTDYVMEMIEEFFSPKPLELLGVDFEGITAG